MASCTLLDFIPECKAGWKWFSDHCVVTPQSVKWLLRSIPLQSPVTIFGFQSSITYKAKGQLANFSRPG
jgi:hypothetical protein